MNHVRNGMILIVLVAMATVWANPSSSSPTAGSPSSTTSRAASHPTSGKGLTIDRQKRQVMIEASVSLQKGALEMALCYTGTHGYESLLTTQVRPSSVHAALLTLGLLPGKPAHWVTAPGKEPVFAPPTGANVDMAIRWKDKSGQVHEAPLSDWLLNAATKKKAGAIRWVFIGSDLLPNGTYWADDPQEGRMISLSNFASSVMEVPFQSSDKDAALEFAVNSDAVPDVGTDVTLILTPVKGAETAPVARMQILIDRMGRIQADGRAVTVEDLETIAREFMVKHSKGLADVRIDPRAMVMDREQVRVALEEGGMTDINIRPWDLGEEVLPRTTSQAARSLQWWKTQFAEAEGTVLDPTEDAQAVLESIKVRQKELESLSRLVGDYGLQIQRLIDEHKARQATRPAK